MRNGLYRYLLICGVILTMVLTACGESPATPTPVPTATVPPLPTNTVPPPTNTVPAATPTAAETPTPAAKSAQQIAKDLRPATVLIKSTFGETAINTEGLGAGTGIVYDSDNGYILTNAHVVEGAWAIQVYQANNPRGRAARVVGRAQCDDLAVLKVDDTTDLVAAPLGDTSKLEPGASVVALGYPESFDLGGDLTVATGVVSKLKAQIDQYSDLVQTDAKITHGNSGGPLVNDRGEVIGINTLGYYSSSGEREQGINFAISMSYAKPIVRDLQAGKNRNYIGLNLFPNVTDFQKYFGTDDGMVVAGVASGSPGDQASIQPADLILKIEGTSITYQNGTSRDKQICDILRSHADGDPLKFQVERASTAQLMEGEVVVGKGGSGTSKLTAVADLSGGGNNGGNNGGDTSNPTATASGGTDTSNFTTIVHTNFANGEKGTWTTDSSANVDRSIANGRLTMHLNTANYWAASFADEVTDLANGFIVTLAQPVGLGGRAGVSFRQSAGTNGNNGYYCFITQDQMFGCDKEVDGSWTPLIKVASSGAIKAKDYNKLAVGMVGDTMVFQVNDQQVASITERI